MNKKSEWRAIVAMIEIMAIVSLIFIADKVVQKKYGKKIIPKIENFGNIVSDTAQKKR